MANQKDGYRYLILGGGRQAEAAAHLALRQADTTKVTIIEQSSERAHVLRERFADVDTKGSMPGTLTSPRKNYADVLDTLLPDETKAKIKEFVDNHPAIDNDRRLRIVTAGVDYEFVTALMKRHDVTMGTTTYEHNQAFTEWAIDAGIHFCDLGGNDAAVNEQLGYADRARAAGVRFAPACGIAPGAVTVLARAGIDRVGIDNVRSVMCYCGGLPQRPTGPLGYAYVFSVHGLIANYLEPVTELADGEVIERESISEISRHDFSDLGLGTLESAATSGALVKATETFRGKIPRMAYETLRYPGHWQLIKTWRELGLFDTQGLKFGGGNVSPRQFMERWLEETLPRNEPDLLMMRVVVEAMSGRTVTQDLLVRHDPATGFSAMQQTTGYSLFIVAKMLVNGTITTTGPILHERDIPPQAFLDAWKRCGINVSVTES